MPPNTAIVETNWNAGRARLENGIFYASDRVVLLDGKPGCGLVIASQTTVEALIAADPDGWVQVEEVPLANSEEWVVSTSTPTWEGEGFLALRARSSGGLAWVLHLDSAESFISAHINGNVIHAASGGYPRTLEWTVDLSHPENVMVRAQSAT